MNKEPAGKPCQNLPCTQEEFNRFALIHGRLKGLMKILRNRSVEDMDKVEYKQIELDEDLTGFWPTIEKMGQRVGIDISGKLDMVKEIIFDKEIQTSLDDIDPGMMTGGLTIDGKYYDEIQLEEMMNNDLEKGSQRREDLIKDLDRIMIRLNKCFGAKEKSDLQQSSPEKAMEEGQRSETIKEKEEGILKPKPPEFLQKLLWFIKYGKKNWGLILLAIIILGIFFSIRHGLLNKIFTLLKNQ